jgi:hypothetical protein
MRAASSAASRILGVAPDMDACLNDPAQEPAISSMLKTLRINDAY